MTKLPCLDKICSVGDSATQHEDIINWRGAGAVGQWLEVKVEVGQDRYLDERLNTGS